MASVSDTRPDAEGNPRALWDAALARWRAADAASDRHNLKGPAPSPVLTAEENDAFHALMDMPAPDYDALRFKLEYWLADDGTETTCAWLARDVQGTMADIRRLLGGA